MRRLVMHTRAALPVLFGQAKLPIVLSGGQQLVNGRRRTSILERGSRFQTQKPGNKKARPGLVAQFHMTSQGETKHNCIYYLTREQLLCSAPPQCKISIQLTKPVMVAGDTERHGPT